MPGNRYRREIERLLAGADVEIDGNRPWDLQVHNEGFYQRVLRHGSLGLGESYMDGWWDCEQLDELSQRLLSSDIEHRARSARIILAALRAKVLNLQAPHLAFRIGQHHYDLGNDLFRHMLDRRMIYSCGYWPGAANLDESQEDKLDLVFRKLGLLPGMRVLDIGCGWGGAAKFAVERFGVTVVGVTVSEEQVRLARQICDGLPVDVRLQDYRDVDERFDRIYSLGMFEHVGQKNYRTFMRVVRRNLHDDGLFLLHTIGRDASATGGDPWIERYIFPHSMLPSARQISTAAERIFVLEDWHNIGPDYDRTLMCWHRNFEDHWPDIRARYDERFHRMWRYFLLTCAGAFRARYVQVWQIVFSCRGVPGGYRSPR